MSSTDSDLQRAAARVHKTTDGVSAVVRQQQDELEKRSLARTVIGISLTMGVSNVILALIALFAVWFALHVQPVYFAADNGRLFPMVPLSAPYVKQADVIDFAKQTMEASNTLDFTNFQAQMEAVRPRYTIPGFSAYVNGMQANGVLAMVRDRRMNLTSSTGTGVLTEEGEQDGVYQWVVKFPITLKLVGQTTEMPEQRLIAMVRVRRVSTLDNLLGIGVSAVVTKPQ